MKKFVTEIVLPLVVTLTLLCVLVIFLANGKTDPFYLRFTGEPTKNLILGTSRAAQGVHPQSLSSILGKDFYNFSFTVAHSPFGPVYKKAISSKLDTTVSNQIFIIAVNPWSISSKCENPNDSSTFRENVLCLAQVNSFCSTPNVEYIRKSLTPIKVIRPYIKGGEAYMVLQPDGWLEVNVSMEKSEVQARQKNKVQTYRNRNLPVYRFSEVRNNSLLGLVKWLKLYGEVYLVRLPIHEEMLSIEDELMPNFKSNIQPSIDVSGGYFDMTKLTTEFRYTDGNHLYKESAFEVSELIGKWIKERQFKKV